MKEEIAAIVQSELASILDSTLAAAIRRLVVEPYPVEREWDYGAPSTTYTCWTVLEHHPSNTGIAYCAQGFGPRYPWGLVFLTGEQMGIGMDCGWFVRLEDAMRDSRAWEGPNPPDYEVP
jgi:hypothetical protein